MKCGDLTHDLLLDPATPDVREHLQGCAECRGRAAELKALAAELAALGRAMPAAEDPALVQRILSRAHRKTAVRYRTQPPAPWR